MSRPNDNELIATVRTLKDALAKAENSLDQAIADAAALTIAMTGERVRLGVAFQCGQDAIGNGTEGLALLSQGRAKIAATHDALFDAGRMLGIPAHMLDGLWGKPRLAAALRVVEAEAA